MNELLSLLPACLTGSACDDAKSLGEMRDAAQTELDLYEERQDGWDSWTPADALAVRRWLARAAKLIG